MNQIKQEFIWQFKISSEIVWKTDNNEENNKTVQWFSWKLSRFDIKSLVSKKSTFDVVRTKKFYLKSCHFTLATSSRSRLIHHQCIFLLRLLLFCCQKSQLLKWCARKNSGRKATILADATVHAPNWFEINSFSSFVFESAE